MWKLLLVALLWLGLEAYGITLAAKPAGSVGMAIWFAVMTSALGFSVISRAKHRINPQDLMSFLVPSNSGQATLSRSLSWIALGIGLAIPGYFSDVLGLFCLIPATRKSLLKVGGFLFHRAVSKVLSNPDLARQAGIRDPLGVANALHRKRREKVIDADFKVLDEKGQR